MMQARECLVQMAQLLLAVEAAAVVEDVEEQRRYEREVQTLVREYARHGGEVLRYGLTASDFVNGYDADLLEELLWVRFGDNNPGLMCVKREGVFCVWVSKRMFDPVRQWLLAGPWGGRFEMTPLESPAVRRLSTPRKAQRFLKKLRRH